MISPQVEDEDLCFQRYAHDPFLNGTSGSHHDSKFKGLPPSVRRIFFPQQEEKFPNKELIEILLKDEE